ncbi:aminodeoxychorismate synthase component I [Parapedomonas caeni]
MLPLAPLRPFALFDDATGTGPSRLLTGLADTAEAHAADDLATALAAIRAGLARGLHAGGWLAYEAGLLLEPRLAGLWRAPVEEPLAWFGLFRDCRLLPPEAMDTFWRAIRPAGQAAAVTPAITEAAYTRAVARIIDYIAAGDVYQVNYTFPAEVAFTGDPVALYRRLREAQRAPHGALIWTGARWLLSLSPELFFALAGDRLTARPMKGTAARRPAPAADRAAAAALAADAKNRAENLMITDLLRNDLARVATVGSVRVPALFTVESYPTVHQMTSTVTATLAPGLDAVDVLTRLFPCGSITGAPKIRAMEIIAGQEARPRGVYTGAVGWLAPAGATAGPGDACFSVAIRTLLVTGDGQARMGLGSGIVADSDPAAEWAECALKGSFAATTLPPFDLIETMAWLPGEGFRHLERHLARLTASATHWRFRTDPQAWRGLLADAATHWRQPMRVRLLVGRSGTASVQAAPMPPAPAEPVTVVLSPRRLDARDPLRAHKTSHRGFYDSERARLATATGCFEVLFANQDDAVVEGSFTNVFVERDGRLLTPPVTAGALPGVLRAALLDSGQAIEAALTLDDIKAADALWVGNSLRGLLRARLVAA